MFQLCQAVSKPENRGKIESIHHQCMNMQRITSFNKRKTGMHAMKEKTQQHVIFTRCNDFNTRRRSVWLTRCNALQHKKQEHVALTLQVAEHATFTRCTGLLCRHRSTRSGFCWFVRQPRTFDRVFKSHICHICHICHI